jgi:hypothetical protein
VNEASGVRVDPEKGKDKHVIDWYGEGDAQVSFGVMLFAVLGLTDE